MLQTWLSKLAERSETPAYLALLPLLGKEIIALQVPSKAKLEQLLPAACYAIALPDAHFRQLAHPGPYQVDLFLQAQTPELALRLSLVLDQFDSSEPALSPQARFALFLHSEEIKELRVSQLQQRLQAWIDTLLAQQHLQIETCPTAAEWQALRKQLEQFIFTRFGLSVEDCLPVDVGQQRDTALLLLAQQSAQIEASKTSQAPLPTAVQPARLAPSSSPSPSAGQVIRRLFVELPALCHAWRMLAWPSDLTWYANWQALAQRIDQVQSIIATPPSSLLHAKQSVQQLHSALEQAWALLAQVQQLPAIELAQHADQHLAAFASLCDAWETALKEAQ